MFIHYRTLAFILKKENFLEADQLFTIYTKDFGKLEVLGKGIRKTSSKLRAGMEIFYLSEIEFIQGKTHKTLTDAILVEKFSNLRKNLKRLAVAYKISEVLNDLILGQEPDEKIWQLLSETFFKLNTYSVNPNFPQLVYYYFFWNFISILGYSPNIYLCSSCQVKLKPERLYFIKEEGGIICQECFKKRKLGKEVEPETIKMLRIILERKWQLLPRLRIKENYLKELKLLSEDYFLHISELVK